MHYFDFVIIGIVLAAMAYLYAFFVKRSNKQSRKEIVSLEELESREYFLYLRSFYEDEFRVYYAPSSFFIPFGMPKFSQDEQLLKFIGFEKTLVKLNNQLISDVKVGASIIKVESDWKELVINLMSDAKLIFINPNDSDGLIWELDKIIENDCLSKTIFLNSFGQSDLSKVVLLKREKFFKFLKSEFGFDLPKKKKNYFQCFTIENSEIVFWFSMKKAITHLKNLEIIYTTQI